MCRHVSHQTREHAQLLELLALCEKHLYSRLGMAALQTFGQCCRATRASVQSLGPAEWAEVGKVGTVQLCCQLCACSALTDTVAGMLAARPPREHSPLAQPAAAAGQHREASPAIFYFPLPASRSSWSQAHAHRVREAVRSGRSKLRTLVVREAGRQDAAPMLLAPDAAKVALLDGACSVHDTQPGTGRCLTSSSSAHSEVSSVA